MKHLCIAALVALAFVSSIDAAEPGKHLFILSGQSNMVRLDPAISFTPTVEAEFGKDNVTVVKDAQGGVPIVMWYKKYQPAPGQILKTKSPGKLYDRLMKKVNAQIKGQTFTTITFVWMQGESDSRKNASVYAASLKGLLEQLKGDLKRKDLNVVIGRISDHDEKRRFPNWEVIRKAQVDVAEATERCVWVDTDDVNGSKNGLHYTREGYKTLGKRFADNAIALIKKHAKQGK